MKKETQPDFSATSYPIIEKKFDSKSLSILYF